MPEEAKDEARYEVNIKERENVYSAFITAPNAEPISIDINKEMVAALGEKATMMYVAHLYNLKARKKDA